MEKNQNLNENDIKLLSLCSKKPLTPTEIIKHLKIAPKNITARIQKLEKLNLIIVEKSGRQKFIKTIENQKVEDFLKILLKKVQDNNGEMSYIEFLSLWENDPSQIDNFMQLRVAKWRSLFEGYLDNKIILNKKWQM